MQYDIQPAATFATAEFEKLTEAWPERGRVLPRGDALRDARRGGGQRSRRHWPDRNGPNRSGLTHLICAISQSQADGAIPLRLPCEPESSGGGSRSSCPQIP